MTSQARPNARLVDANRRQFLGWIGTTVAASAAINSVAAGDVAETPSGTVIDSPPVLQTPTEDGITVVWAVSAQALGAVEFGFKRDALTETAFGEVTGLKANDDRFLQVRLEGLQPNMRYFYRTVTTPFIFHNSHKLEAKEPILSDVFSFVTPGKNSSEASFSVINDTHNNQPTLQQLMPHVVARSADYTIWNGDIVSSCDSADQAVEAILRPGGVPFAVEKPVLLVPGNHDHRGIWARNLSKVMVPWEHAVPSDRKLIRNFVVRTGPLVIIGLDTGEDKPDHHPAWAGQARFEPYRVAQRDWLKRVLASDAVVTAPFVVTIAHIPIFDANPNANGGDVLENWAQFQRRSGELWGPLMHQHGVQLHIAAHVHRHRYDAPNAERCWGQITGGGHDPKGQVTIVYGKTHDNRLVVVAEDPLAKRELGTWTFTPRKV